MKDSKVIFAVMLLIISAVVAYFLLREDEEDILKNLSKEQVHMVDAGGIKLADISGAITGGISKLGGLLGKTEKK